MNEAAIESTIEQMTIEEKVSLLAGADHWTTRPLARLGIPAIKVSDGPNGARGTGEDAGPSSACFPVGVAMAATWNTGLIREVGQGLAQEAQDKGAHILLGPTVNIHRSPLAGRNFECFSEDPYLSGQMATAYIQGLQSRGVGACIKHFVCNDSEFERRTLSTEVWERALREIYLAPFRMAVKQAGPWTLMSAYNAVNGVSASENRALLVDILKKEWGFDGLVMSDWYGTYSPAAAGNGLDLEMPGPARWLDQRVAIAILAGEVLESDIDDSIRRLLRTILRVDAYELAAGRPERSVDRPEHRRLIRRAAEEAIVLLTNSGQALPIQLDQVRSIAVIGDNARHAQVQGGGSARVTPHYAVSPLEGIRSRVGDQARVAYDVGCPVHRLTPPVSPAWLAAGADGEAGWRLQLFEDPNLAGDPAAVETVPEAQLTWSGDADPRVDPTRFSARLSAVLTAPATGTFTFGLVSVGRGRLIVDGRERIDNWSQPVYETELQAQVNLVEGKAYEVVVEYGWEAERAWRTVRLGCLPPVPEGSVEAAAQLAASVDVAIVFAGLTNEWDTEGRDRGDMELPGDQNRLIEAVAASNPNTVVVLNSGSAVRMPWIEHVAAVLETWYGGQEIGNAVAGVLFGDVNPSGKLPQTFPKRLEDNPAYLNYPGENGQVHYGEGIFVGYRYYDKKDVEPLFPFGHGLSYTSFAYDNLRLSAPQVAPGETVQVSLDLTNTGTVPGQEVVQLYVRDVEARLARPQKELKGFAKVALAAGETKTVTMPLDRESFAYYDPAAPGWVTEAGDFQVLVGSSSRDIRLVGQLTLQG